MLEITSKRNGLKMVQSVPGFERATASDLAAVEGGDLMAVTVDIARTLRTNRADAAHNRAVPIDMQALRDQARAEMLADEQQLAKALASLSPDRLRAMGLQRAADGGLSEGMDDDQIERASDLLKQRVEPAVTPKASVLAQIDAAIEAEQSAEPAEAPRAEPPAEASAAKRIGLPKR